MTLFAALILFLWLGIAWDVMLGNRRMRRLARLKAPVPPVWPRVSIVIAARNEAGR